MKRVRIMAIVLGLVLHISVTACRWGEKRDDVGIEPPATIVPQATVHQLDDEPWRGGEVVISVGSGT